MPSTNIAFHAHATRKTRFCSKRQCDADKTFFSFPFTVSVIVSIFPPSSPPGASAPPPTQPISRIRPSIPRCSSLVNCVLPTRSGSTGGGGGGVGRDVWLGLGCEVLGNGRGMGGEGLYHRAHRDRRSSTLHRRLRRSRGVCSWIGGQWRVHVSSRWLGSQ